MTPEYRFQFYIDAEHRIIVVRVIGHLSVPDFIDKVFERLSQVEEPWTYERLFDLRRWDERLGHTGLQEMAERWAALTEGNIFHARIAVVSFDSAMAIRVPAISPLFPNETVCWFADFHEAIGWLLAPEPARYLDRVRLTAPARATDGRIVIEDGASHHKLA